ncbi:MAG: hypothetical protein OXL96_20770 [Candidatus Poribacteria bacterium]|nr:hypothetical protein [Candidatus Poribacteria bacterium]
MKRLSAFVYFALFLIVATALWYFGHHRPTQEILRAEPQKIYRPVTPLARDTSAAKKQPAETHSVHSLPEETRELSVTETANGTSPPTISDVPNTGIQNQNDVKGTQHADIQHEDAQKKVISESEKMRMMEKEHNAIIDRALHLSEAALSRVKKDTPMMVAMLNQMPLEEQRTLLNEGRKTIYSQISKVYIPEEINHLFPDPADQADQVWYTVVDWLAEHGYRIPSGWKELQ